MSRILWRANTSVFLLLATILMAAILTAACRPITATPPAQNAQAAAHVQAPATDTDPHRILFLGDYFTSQNLGIASHTAALAAAVASPVEVDQVTVDIESGLQNLWDTTDAPKQVRAGWDVVVLEQDLANMKDPVIFQRYAANFISTSDAAGARTVLFMPWEYDIKLKAHPIDEIARVCGEIGAKQGVEVAPVGLAWQRAHQERPFPNLYLADGINSSIYGTYLTACVLYATIYNRDPSGLAYRPADLFPDASPIIKDLVRQWPKLTDDEAAFLQRIAWETVRDYKAGQ
ncbi:MAG: hypothetical protein U0X20_17605 [Caldilineaceae bacterium]